MAESVKEKRIFLPRGEQRFFISRVNTKLSIQEMARLCRCSERTIRDWHREKFSMDLKCALVLSQKTNTSLPKNLKTKKRFWYVARAAAAGGAAVVKKYGRVGGNPENRKRKWRAWWEQKGKYKKHSILYISKPFRKPPKSERLAEFIGIAMGDGGISKRQVCITLHHKDDKEYAQFVADCMKKLFGVTPSIYHSEKYSVNDIVISRSELVKYLVFLGLVTGNKIRQHIDIPKWIKQNRKFRIACLRGLIDADGSIFTHSYKVKNKWYHYKKLSFTTASLPLRNSVYKIFKETGFHPRISGKRDIRLDSKEDVKRYFKVINSHNQKHRRHYFGEVA